MRRSARQRAASRRNLIKARRVRAHDTWTHWGKKGLSAMVSTATFGTGNKANTWISGNYRKKPSKLFKDRSKRH
ncbi:hypothetical protein SEA_LABELLE_12 [Mycobacterium phage Labelle]|nr:hypothetical protein SEA_LABELLE_12 [Mycobacterium phage Labelle]